MRAVVYRGINDLRLETVPGARGLISHFFPLEQTAAAIALAARPAPESLKIIVSQDQNLKFET